MNAGLRVRRPPLAGVRLEACGHLREPAQERQGHGTAARRRRSGRSTASGGPAMNLLRAPFRATSCRPGIVPCLSSRVLRRPIGETTNKSHDRTSWARQTFLDQPAATTAGQICAAATPRHKIVFVGGYHFIRFPRTSANPVVPVLHQQRSRNDGRRGANSQHDLRCVGAIDFNDLIAISWWVERDHQQLPARF
jgi:hypothetical protein